MNLYCSKSWTDINIDFQERTLSHCCKSVKYKFPEELTLDFINNSQQIISRRADTLNAIPHSDCNFCWKNYQKGNNSYRDFMNTWTDDFVKHNVIDDSYVCNIEIKFDNICDMSCIYCGADSSSKIASEENIKHKSLYNNNDYEIFKEWVVSYLTRPDLKSNKIFIIILGGEPTISKKFYNFVDFLEGMCVELTHLDIQVGVITNANSNRYMIDKFLKKIEYSNLKWVIIISNESIEQDSVHERDGLIWKNFENNVISYLSHNKIETISFLPTINVLSVKHFSNYIQYINDLVLIHGNNKKIFWNGNYIEYPKVLDISNLPLDYLNYVNKSRSIMLEHVDKINFIHISRFLDFLNFIESRIGKEYNENYINDIENFLNYKSKIKQNKQLINLLKKL